jgi:hypothetical protein
MARRYKRDSKGRFSSTAGGGATRGSEQQAVARRSSRAQDVFFGRGEKRSERSAAKQVKAQETAAKAARVYAKRSKALESKGGSKLGGQRKVAKLKK